MILRGWRDRQRYVEETERRRLVLSTVALIDRSSRRAYDAKMSSSTTLDPGELLLAVEERARRAPTALAKCATSEIRASRDALKLAVADLDRLLALIPAGETNVPADALTSALSRDISARAPELFARATLEMLRQKLKKHTHTLTGELGDRADPAFAARTKAAAGVLLTGIQAEDPLARTITSGVPMRHIERDVTFRATNDARYPYAADINGERWAVRINEFPEEPSVYSLLIDGQIVEELMDWPAAWTRPASAR
jgi:hypothetical protein